MRSWAFLALLGVGCTESKLPTAATSDPTGSAPTSPTGDPEPEEGEETPTESTPTPSTATDTGTPPTTTTTGVVDDSVQQLCVDEINAYRASIGLPPYARWTAGEACADDQARQDAESGVPHGAFGQCGEWAQNECPGWWGSEEDVIVDCLAMMWAEGPGADFQQHGHYINMSSTDYGEVACGFYTTPDGAIWAIQNFR